MFALNEEGNLYERDWRWLCVMTLSRHLSTPAKLMGAVQGFKAAELS
jgi:hypothetical protein